MIKKVFIYFLSILLITSCTSSNEDPTNIELEVLRVSLLEKELSIDELHQSLDDTNRQNNTLVKTVEELESSLEKQKELNLKLIDGQDQILTIQENRPHFYDVVNDALYILTAYDNAEFDEYSYEELFRYSQDEVGQVIYRGKEIQYKVDSKSNVTSILDQKEFQIIDKNLVVRYKYEIDLNEPLIELSSTLYLDDATKQVSYVFLWKYIEDEIPTLYSVISFDYHNLEDIVSAQYNLITQDYQISDEVGTMVYVDQENNRLINLNLLTGDKEVLLQNKTEPFSMYKNDGNIYYFDQEKETFIRYDNN